MKKKLPKIATGGEVTVNPLEIYANGGLYLIDLDNKSDTVKGIADVYSGGGIHIKPENKGKFTAFAKRKGMGVQEAASHVLANKDRYSPTVVKRANFARNASKWEHEDGGLVKYWNGGPESGRPVLVTDMLEPEIPSDEITKPKYTIQTDNTVVPKGPFTQPVTGIGTPITITSDKPQFTWAQPDAFIPPKEPDVVTPPETLYKPSLTGVAVQGLSGALNYAGQLRNINRLKAPGVIPNVKYAPTPSPKYVDMSAQLTEADRDYKAAVDQISKSGGSLAQKQAILSQLQAGRFAKRGQTVQAEENANAQIYNQYQQLLTEKDMRQKTANTEIMLQNIANKYGYDMTQVQGRNAALAMLSNIISQAGGAYTNLESQKLGISALSKAYTKGLPDRHFLNEVLYGKQKTDRESDSPKKTKR